MPFSAPGAGVVFNGDYNDYVANYIAQVNAKHSET